MKPWFDRGTLKALAFYTIVLTIVICGLALILTIWDIIRDEELRNDILLTVIVIATASLLVCLTNWAFLSANEETSQAEADESAIGRALQKAKISREERKEG